MNNNKITMAIAKHMGCIPFVSTCNAWTTGYCTFWGISMLVCMN